MDMTWEMGNDILKSLDGPTSIFLAGSSQFIMVSLIVMIVVGIVICFFGLKLMRILAAAAGLTVGALIGTAVVLGIGITGTAVPVIILGCVIVLAVLCAVIRRLGAFVLVFLNVAGIAAALLWPRTLILVGICGAAALLMAVLAIIKTEAVVIVITGVSGGLSVGMSISALTGLNEKNWWLGYVISVVLALIGVWVQFMVQSRKIGKKEEVYSKQVREEVSRESEVERARQILGEEDDDEEDENSSQINRNRNSKEKKKIRKDSRNNKKRKRDEDNTEENVENEDDITIISEDL